ncbi:MAG TPA: NAD(P)H-dependent oxidoreductase subunit E, partial [Xanthomonadales bacterium]|nr:NAD(P)H-dependent oxidoreductase subunit E [Xanthomonadales bacterium]
SLGHIPAEAVPMVAEGLNLSRAEVHGVIGFYHDFHTEPRGDNLVQLCRAEACQAGGGRELESHARDRLGIDYGGTTSDGKFTLEPVFCLGNCACTPSVRINDDIHADVTPKKLDDLLAQAKDSSRAIPENPEGLSGVDPKTQAGQGSTRVLVPMDTTSVARGADQVVAAIEAEAMRLGISVSVERNGSRGAFWLETLVEVEDPDGHRRLFGPVQPDDVSALFESGFPGACDHELALGKAEDIPWLERQRRLTFARAGLINPLSIEEYEASEGFDGLRRAIEMDSQTLVNKVKDSGLRGRGGAAFPTGIKWQTVLETPAEQKYIVCNADEGDSGTFADRLLMEADPYQLIEGMIIAGLAVGATEGFVYLRSEYPVAARIFSEAIDRARQAGFLGDNILNSGRSFNLELRIGAGAYICGEETSLLDSLEGKRGLIRFKPPLPAIRGLMGMPTVVNNVLTLAAVSTILARGARYYRDFGTGESRGTLTVQLAGNIKRGGLVELEFGHTLRELVEDWGGGTASGRPIRAIQVGGPLGAYLPESHWDVALDYEEMSKIGGMLGHGGIVVFDDTVDMLEQARFAMEFCAVESCGKCTPCRVGSVRGVELIERIGRKEQPAADLELLDELCTTMVDGSLCAMGGLTPYPVRSAVTHFGRDFGLEND